jgi:hypothetical protein
MASQLEALKEALQETLQDSGGRETPFVQGLKAQIANLEKPRSENPMAQRYSAGMRAAPEALPTPPEPKTP